MQRVLGFLAIYSGLKTKIAIVRKTKNTEGGISIDRCSNRTGIDVPEITYHKENCISPPYYDQMS